MRWNDPVAADVMGDCGLYSIEDTRPIIEMSRKALMSSEPSPTDFQRFTLIAFRITGDPTTMVPINVVVGVLYIGFGGAPLERPPAKRVPL
jgi:hypothetical protein